MSPLAIFLLSLVILRLRYVCIADNAPLNDDERNALLEIMKIPHAPNFTWNLSEPACNWKGVTCFTADNFTTVIDLRLPGKSFLGPIPPNTLGKFISLRVLSLHYNGFSGELPSDFANLTTLTRLHLAYNNFTGQIPSNLTKFTQLTRLYLNNNNFTGQLPFINAENLVQFNVSSNQFNSSIPHSLSKFELSLFNPNVYLCGPPTDKTCNSTYPSPYLVVHDKNKNKTPLIVGISLGSALVLLVLLCCLRKMDRNVEKNKLVLYDNAYSFDLEDLLKASALFLGEGSVGNSYKQVIKGSNTVVKRLKDVVVTENEFKKTMEGLASMNKSFVVPLIGCYYSRDERLVVYEYVSARSLSSHLHGIGSQQTKPDWYHRKRVALSVAKGLKYLHVTEKVVHGNIKSSNILIQPETNDEACLTDYGLNTLFGESIFDNHHVTGYSAPEVPKTKKVTFESDVYSFGVLLVELLTGKNPKQASLRKEIVHFSKLVESVVCEEEPKVEIFDEELRIGYNTEEMMQLLRIAKECVLIVPDQRPAMHVVLSKMDQVLSPDDHSKGSDYTPSTETRDTPSTITP